MRWAYGPSQRNGNGGFAPITSALLLRPWTWWQGLWGAILESGAAHWLQSTKSRHEGSALRMAQAALPAIVLCITCNLYDRNLPTPRVADHRSCKLTKSQRYVLPFVLLTHIKRLAACSKANARF